MNEAEMTVAEFAERSCQVPPRASAYPGKFKVGVHAVARGSMLAVRDEGVREIVITTAASMGKTRLLENLVGYADLAIGSDK